MNFRNIRLPKWLIQSIIMICFCAQSATAQFVLNLSETGTETTLSGDFSQLQLDNNTQVQWESDYDGTLLQEYLFLFSNGTATNDANTTFSTMTGSIILWATDEDQIAKVYLTLNDDWFSERTLKDFTFTASSLIQLNEIEGYIDAKTQFFETTPSVDETTLSISAIPEPSTYAAILGGLALLGFQFSKRRKKKQD